MDKAPSMPTATSITGKPTLSGGASSPSPDIIIMPVIAWTTWSYAPRCDQSPCWPKPEMEQYTMSGRTAWIDA
ncbi:hypothetical protein D3C75_1316590 [compost metagenome]